MALEIWIPGSAETNYICRLCKEPFATRPNYERHVLKCCVAREAAIHEDRPSVKNPLIQGGIWDKDLEKWMAEHDEELKEGRLSL